MSIEVVVFGAPWCGTCTPYKAGLDRAGIEYTFKNVDDHVDECTKLNLMSVPTTIIYKDGVQVERFAGNRPASYVKGLIEEAMNV